MYIVIGIYPHNKLKARLGSFATSIQLIIGEKGKEYTINNGAWSNQQHDFREE